MNSTVALLCMILIFCLSKLFRTDTTFYDSVCSLLYENEAFSYLSLSEGDGVEFVATKTFVFSKLQQGHSRVSPRGQDKDERGTAVRVRVGFGQIKWRRFHKLLTKFTHHKYCDSCADLRKREAKYSVNICLFLEYQ